MKVYIIYTTDGHNKVAIEHIFSTRRSAMDYVISSKFSWNSFYTDRDQEFLDSEADKLVTEFIVLP